MNNNIIMDITKVNLNNINQCENNRNAKGNGNLKTHILIYPKEIGILCDIKTLICPSENIIIDIPKENRIMEIPKVIGDLIDLKSVFKATIRQVLL